MNGFKITNQTNKKQKQNTHLQIKLQRDYKDRIEKMKNIIEKFILIMLWFN